jgi:hypothetical protein
MATATPNNARKSATTSKAAPPQNRRNTVSQTSAANQPAPTVTQLAPTGAKKSDLSALLSQAQTVASMPATKVNPEIQVFAEAMISNGYEIKNLPKGDATDTLMSQLRQYGNARTPAKKFKTRTNETHVFFQFLNEEPTKRS